MVKLIKTKVEWVFHVAGCKPPMDSSLELVWSKLWTIITFPLGCHNYIGFVTC